MSAARDQLTPREVAERTGFSYHAILRAIKRGDLAACEPIPGRLRIEVEEYERWRTQPARRSENPHHAHTETPRRSPRRPRQGSFRAELSAVEEEAA